MIRHAVHFWQEYRRCDTICSLSHLNRWQKTITYSISGDADFDHFIRRCLTRLYNVVLLPFVVDEFFLAGDGDTLRLCQVSVQHSVLQVSFSRTNCKLLAA